MVMIVLNNHGYGAMKSFSQLLGRPSEPPGIPSRGFRTWTSLADLGRPELKSRGQARSTRHRKAPLKERAPTLIDIQIDPNAGDLY
jgi:thiamine pyrophosphate-dependent acetolactate synthase large subunit-like protein